MRHKSYEKTSSAGFQPKTRAHPRVSQAHEKPWRAKNPGSSSKKRALADHPVVTLRADKAFQDVYRRGRWARGALLSLGAMASGAQIRIGVRTKRGLKGAVVRNRLKRQLRAIISASDFSAFQGADLVVVVHPSHGSASTEDLKQELLQLCGRLAKSYRAAPPFSS